MKFKSFIYVIIGILVLGVSSCKKDKMVVAPDHINIKYSGCDTSIIVNGCDTSYTVTHAPKWVEIEKNDSVLSCKFLYNASGADRNDSIVIMHGEEKAIVKLTQWKKASYIKVDREKLEFGLGGGQDTVKVETDGPEANIEIISPAVVSTSLDNGILTITVPEKLEEHLEGIVLLVIDDLKVGVAISGGPKPLKETGPAGVGTGGNKSDVPMSGEMEAL